MYLCKISIKEYLLIIIACFSSLNFMKNLKAPFLAVALIILNVSFMAAGSSNPPPPDMAGKSAESMTTMSEDDCEPFCNPPFPIDQNIVFLLIGGLALGATVIYKNQIKKASI